MTIVQRKTDGLAIASLVLGILPIAIVVLGMIAPREFIPMVIWQRLVLDIIFPLVLILAVICGHVARSRIKKSPDTLTGGGIASTGLVMGYTLLVLCVLSLIISSAINKIKEDARYINCMSNQHFIYKAAAEWGNDHSNSFPPDLQTLVNEGRLSSNSDAFICPCSGRKTGPISQVDQWSDYIIVSNRNFGDGQSVLIYEKPDCHKGKGGNVTMANGSSIWCNAEEYHRRTDGLKR